MLISINGKEIYKGECGFVRGNWSGRKFEIPADVLQRGKNIISIKNVTKGNRDPFIICFVLISDLKLEIAPKPEAKAQE